MAARTVALPLIMFVLMTHSLSADAQIAPGSDRATEAIRYTVSFPEPHTHYIEVSAAVPTGGRPSIEMMMPVWTPGSYLVREYERNVERVTASAPGRGTLGVEKSDKNRWRIATGGAPIITVSYRVYAHEMSVRTNWVEAGFALINGAPTFMTLADPGPRPHEVVLNLPATWKRSTTGLRPFGNAANQYIAADYDTLVDSPILAGNPAVHEFTVGGKPHFLVNEGEAGVFDGARAAKDLEAVINEHHRFWGDVPYDKYVILNVLTERSGGLEHKNSTVLMASRWATRTRSGYVDWLTTASHEIFHAWNGKRLRPVELGPFNYEEEVHTRSLWVVEGLTDYYGYLIARRAGLITEDEFLQYLSGTVQELQNTPGRLVQSAELASFDAWIKFYRPDENSPNASISYYTKGIVLGFLLDAKIRRATSGARSLDDVMRAAYARYSGARGYTADQFREVAEQIAGTSLAGFWETAVRGTGELDYAEALATYGLHFRASQSSGRAWLGVSTRNDQGRLVIAEVRRDTPAIAAGLNVEDEILAIDDFRVRPEQLARRLEQYRPGDQVTILVARRDQLLRMPVTLGAEPPGSWRLERDGAASDTQRLRLAEWLRGRP